MKLTKITNVKHFMNKLLIENAFDSFLISEACVKTCNTFIIDCHINKEFYTQAELDELAADAESEDRIYSDRLSRWGTVKPHVLALIKGSKTPLYFKMSFYLAGENVNKLLSSFDTTIKSGDIDGLSLIVKFENDELIVTSSSTLKIFSLDKSLDKYWDEMVLKFLSSHEISYEVM